MDASPAPEAVSEGSPDRGSTTETPRADAPLDGADAARPPDTSADADADTVEAGPSEVGPAAAGLVLHWRFDDPASSPIAADSSGNGLDGTYQGSVSTYVAEHAPSADANLASRRFTNTDQAVVLDSAFQRLRPTTSLTVSIWFRTSVTARTDLVCFNTDYFIRYMPPELEFVHRQPLVGGRNFLTATAPMVAANDDRWHHVVGTATPELITLWLDGVLIASEMTPNQFLYTAGVNRLIVGRSVEGVRAFVGWLDDLRIYDRVLADDEIRALSRRAP